MKMTIRNYALGSILLYGAVFLVIAVNYFLVEREKNAELLLSTLRKQSVEISHTLSIKSNSYDDIKRSEPALARQAANDRFVDGYIIADEQNIIMTTDPSLNKIPKTDVVCESLRQCDPFVLLKKHYFKERFVFFDDNKKHKVYLYVVTDMDEIDEYLNSTLVRALMMFGISTLLLTALLFFGYKRYLINPLELLRQFAYYQSETPPVFKVTELEYIRASLAQTFKRLEEERKELYSLANTDQLSGLLNRNALFDRVGWLITEASRSNNKFAVLFLDLDNFKDVNDSLGHKVGDIFLAHLALFLQRVIRADDFIARVGGDEFVIVIRNYESHLELIDVLQRLLLRIKEPFLVESHTIHTSASIGVVIYPKDGSDINTLLKHADIAMYEAKRKGRDQYSFFTDSLNQKVQEDLRLDKAIRVAIPNDEFKLFYQPKVDLASGRIVGSEALIRWFHPEDGMIAPDRFISLCEHNGYIVTLGEWVLKEALKQQVLWKNQALFDLPVSINMSPKQLNDKNFLQIFRSILAASSIEPCMLDVEITEYTLMEHSDRNLSVMESLHDLGVTISLDDFGTGYSSLSYLKKFTMDVLKIDKSFMDDYGSRDGAIFIETIVNMAKTLGMKVVAEGVELEEQVEFLKEIGCDIYQGYYCSKPVSADDFAALVKKYNGSKED